MTGDGAANSAARRDAHTIHDVARQAGVSAASVSRVLNGHPNVSAPLRARVEAAMRDLAYRPNPAAQSVRGGQTKLIGFLLDSMINGPIYASIDGALREHGYAILLTNAEQDPALASAYLDLMAQRRVDGLLIDSGVAGQDGVIDKLIGLRIPTVVFDHERPPDAPLISAVQSDLASGIEVAVAHLAAQGHRRIALIGGPDWWWPARERLRGYGNGLRAAGLAPDQELIYRVPMEAAPAATAFGELLGRDEPPSALIVGGNILLLGVLRALGASGRAVGRDLALIGADDLDLTQLYSPPITVIARDLAQRAAAASALLLETIARREGRTIMLPTELVVRASSTRPPRAGGNDA